MFPLLSLMVIAGAFCAARLGIWRQLYYLGISVIGAMMVSFGLLLLVAEGYSLGAVGASIGMGELPLRLLYAGAGLFWGGLLGACFYRPRQSLTGEFKDLVEAKSSPGDK